MLYHMQHPFILITLEENRFYMSKQKEVNTRKLDINVNTKNSILNAKEHYLT